MRRDRQSLEKLYGLLPEKFNRARFEEHIEIRFANFFGPALVPSEPSSPSLVLPLLIAGILGLGVGLGVVSVKEHYDGRIEMPDDLKRRGF